MGPNKLPQVMSLESASFGGKKEFETESKAARFSRTLQPVPHLCLIQVANSCVGVAPNTPLNLQPNCCWSSCIVGNLGIRTGKKEEFF